jgi:hypothetical protein
MQMAKTLDVRDHKDTFAVRGGGLLAVPKEDRERCSSPLVGQALDGTITLVDELTSHRRTF